MFDWLRELGHTIEDPVPSLFTFNLPGHPITELMGVSVEMAKVKIAQTKLEQAGPVLITHWGLSGPAILRLSAWGARELAEKKYEYTAHINWLHGLDYNEPMLQGGFLNLRDSHSSHKIISHNFGQLPQRLWQFLLTQSGVDKEMRFADLPKKIEKALIQNLVNYTVQVKGKTTFKEEFVTAGGIKLNEVDPNTMMSRKIPNLYFAGEILNVDGITGGFNFQHAWTSGFVAAGLRV
jgi:predicted Rossmann fold flavoprotein